MTEPLKIEVVDSKAPNPNFDGKQEVARKPAPQRRVFTKPAEPKTKTPPKPRTATPMPPKGTIKDALTPLYAMAGAMIITRNEVVGTAILENAENCAASLEALAETNEAVRRALVSLTKGSVWGAVAMAHAPIFMAVMSEMQKPKTTIEPDEEKTESE